jgi:hypothetical protein
MPCCDPLTLACAARGQKVTTICGFDGEWEVNTVCLEGQYCDSSHGENAGRCRDVVVDCRGRAPAARYCMGNVLMECGPDLVTTSVVQECPAGCSDGACVNACVDKEPGTQFCTADVAVSCDASSEQASAVVCLAGCVDGQCLDGEPCPEEQPGVTIQNCSPYCGEVQANCLDHSDCPGQMMTLSDAPALLRLPPASFLQGCSGCGGQVRALHVRVSGGHRVAVPEPWYIALFTGEPARCDEGNWVNCHTFTELREFMVVTKNESAPQVNVEIDAMAEVGGCP